MSKRNKGKFNKQQQIKKQSYDQPIDKLRVDEAGNIGTNTPYGDIKPANEPNLADLPKLNVSSLYGEMRNKEMDSSKRVDDQKPVIKVVPTNDEFNEIQNMPYTSEEVKSALVRLHQLHIDVKTEVFNMYNSIKSFDETSMYITSGLYVLTGIEIVAPHILKFDETDDIDGYFCETCDAFGIKELPEEVLNKIYLVQFIFTIDGVDINVRCARIYHGDDDKIFEYGPIVVNE